LALVKTSNEVFSGLPLFIRQKFDHNVSALIDWLADPANEAESIKIGLREPVKNAPPVEPVKLETAPVVQPTS